MFTTSLQRSLLGAFLISAAALASTQVAQAQICPSGTDTFWKVDKLPDAPQGQITISVIPGLCEGEGAANVFTIPAGSALQRLTQVVAPFGAAGGAGGFTASLNVQVFDGVSFSGPFNTPTLGPKVFDLAADFSSNMQVNSTGLNIFDMTPYNVEVGASGLGNFVVAFIMDINPNGDCATGYSANFFTDNTQGGFFGCDPNITPAKTSLMFILGQGWVDVSTATVTGIQICPLFYSGIWGIRACSEDAGPTNPLQVSAAPNPAPVGGFTSLTFAAPGFEGVPYFAAASFGNTPGTPTPSGTVPLNIDSLFSLSISTPSVFVNFAGLISSTTGTAPGLIFIPTDPSLAGVSFFVSFVTLPAGGAPWGISSALKISIQ